MPNTKKIALITGSNRGIGFETARQLGEKGVTVIVTARNRNDVDETVKILRGQGVDAEGVVLDVTRAEDRKAVAEFVASKFGKLDILINNAGVAPAEGIFGSRASETTEDELQTIFNINLFSVIAFTRELLPLLKKSDAGRIVNVSSVLGSQTIHASQPSPIASMRRFSYNASKSALNMFTIHLAAEHQCSSELRPSRVGQDGSWHAGRSHVGTGWRQDKRCGCASWIRRPERPLHPRNRQADALVMVSRENLSGLLPGLSSPRTHL
jgi:NAD(P)-dependent dehydrogenase (short-subunit alcohol dehydrogenase family)